MTMLNKKSRMLLMITTKIQSRIWEIPSQLWLATRLSSPFSKISSHRCISSRINLAFSSMRMKRQKPWEFNWKKSFSHWKMLSCCPKRWTIIVKKLNSPYSRATSNLLFYLIEINKLLARLKQIPVVKTGITIKMCRKDQSYSINGSPWEGKNSNHQHLKQELHLPLSPSQTAGSKLGPHPMHPVEPTSMGK